MSARRALQELARSTIGALNLGLPLLYTMETWWLAWRLPLWLLATFALVGIAAIAVVADVIGVRPGHRRGDRMPLPRLARSVVKLLMSSLVAGVVVLLLFGIVEPGDPFQDVVRHALIHIVPLGLGAAVADIAFATVDGDDPVPTFAEEMGAFALGAAFFAFAVAPTEEMELMPAHAGWWRIGALVAFTIALTYLVLYVVEFRGRAGRLAGMRAWHLRIGETLAGYAVALAVSAFLLFGYGQLADIALTEMVQKVVVLAFIAGFGGAAARVVV